ncbi:hypothetical protein QR98_0036880 [Sarcoptes scabiei]|uniref:Uncharacterized protein n=1 Tax=Sarcoptes scabiei TaxID=52283 RepID=A0A132A2H5_SARSC|nr:hypothetical protein QR98_0036880 [Sarcoptes scabiei]
MFFFILSSSLARSRRCVITKIEFNPASNAALFSEGDLVKKSTCITMIGFGHKSFGCLNPAIAQNVEFDILGNTPMLNLDGNIGIDWRFDFVSIVSIKPHM